MPGRVNTKFVLILGTVLVVLTGAVVATYTVVNKTDPAEYVRRGNELYNAGQYRAAAEQFGRALRQNHRDVPLILKYVDAVNQFEVTTSETARQHVEQIQILLNQANEVDPQNPEPFQRLMDLLMTIGRDMGQFQAWDRMLDRANSVLRVQPNNLVARKYRGIAQVNRMQAMNLTDEQIEDARNDLLAAMTQNDDDPDKTFYLAVWNLVRAQREALPGGETPRVSELRNEARRILTDALDRHPDDMRRAVDLLKVLLDLREFAQADALTQRIEAHLLKTPQPASQVIEVARLLPVVNLGGQRRVSESNTLATLNRSEALLRAGAQAHPKDLRFQIALGQVLAQQNRRDEAMKVFSAARQVKVKATPLKAFPVAEMQMVATLQYVELVFTQLDEDNAQQRQAKLNEVESLIRELKSAAGDSGLVNLLAGRLDLARGNWRAAANQLDRASSLFNDSRPEVLLLSAQARMQMKETGAAAQRLERIIELRPRFMPARYELVRLRVNAKQYDQAQDQVNEILRLDPNDFQGQRLAAMLLAEQGQSEKAIELLRKLDPAKHPELIMPLAQIYAATGKPEQALPMLEEHLATNPRDIMAIQLLARTANDHEKVERYIAASRAAGGDETALTLLAAQTQDPASTARELEKLIDKESDPVERHLKRFDLYRRMNRPADAKAQLDAAAKLNGNHAGVVSRLFELALAEDRLDEADQLALRAGRLNLDSAEGAFYIGRVALARGDSDRAQANFRRGLIIQPIYSEGWRLLGDAMRMAVNLTEARSAYERAIEQRPENVAAVRALAAVQDMQRNPRQALANLRRAATLTPNDRALRNEYLFYEQLHGDPSVALKMRQGMAQQDPRDDNNRRTLALLLARMNRPAEASAVIDKLVTEQGVTRANLEARAGILALLGKPNDGRKLLQDYVHSLGDKVTDEDWRSLARYLWGVAQYDNAVSAYKQAITLEDPKLRPTTRELADVLFAANSSDCVELYRTLWASDQRDDRMGLRLVEALLRVGSFDEAETVLVTLNANHKLTGTLCLLNGMLASARNQVDRAVEWYNRGLEVDPKRATLYLFRAQTNAAFREREQQALADARHALELDPSLLQGRHLLASIYLRRGERGPAITELQSAVDRAPGDRATRLRLADVLTQARDWSRLRALLDESAQRFPRDPVWPARLGKWAVETGNLSLAIQSYQQALDMAEHPATLMEIVDTQIKANRPSDALATLGKYPQLVSSQPLLQAARGRALAAMKQRPQAVAAYEAAINAIAQPPQVFGVVSQMVLGLGREETMSQLESWSTGKRTTLLQTALAQLQIGDRRYNAAYERLKRLGGSVSREHPEFGIYLQLYAVAAQQCGDVAEAIGAYEQLLTLDERDVRSLNNLAYLLTESRRVEEGLRLAEKAQSLQPDDAQVLDTLGWAQFKAGQVEQARLTLERSVDAQPFAENCRHLGEVLLARGDRRNGIEWFKQAKRLADETGDNSLSQVLAKRLLELGE